MLHLLRTRPLGRSAAGGARGSGRGSWPEGGICTVISTSAMSCTTPKDTRRSSPWTASRLAAPDPSGADLLVVRKPQASPRSTPSGPSPSPRSPTGWGRRHRPGLRRARRSGRSAGTPSCGGGPPRPGCAERSSVKPPRECERGRRAMAGRLFRGSAWHGPQTDAPDPGDCRRCRRPDPGGASGAASPVLDRRRNGISEGVAKLRSRP